MRPRPGTAAVIAALLFFTQVLNAQDTLEKDPAAFVRDGYHRLARDSFGDYDEYRKLLDSCKLQIAILAENDPEGLVALAREIIPEGPTLLEGEKQRGLKPGRLELKSSLMSAVVIVGGDDAYELLMELKEKVESGDAQKQALGANPADLLEVPVKFDRMLSDALEGNSADPYNDLKNAIRFAQEHFVARLLLAKEIPGLSPEQMLEIKKLALERIRRFLSREKPVHPLTVLVYWEVCKAIADVLCRKDSLALPDDMYEQVLKIIEENGKNGEQVGRDPVEKPTPVKLKEREIEEIARPPEKKAAPVIPRDEEVQETSPYTYIMVLAAAIVGILYLLIRRLRAKR